MRAHQEGSDTTFPIDSNQWFSTREDPFRVRYPLYKTDTRTTVKDSEVKKGLAFGPEVHKVCVQKVRVHGSNYYGCMRLCPHGNEKIPLGVSSEWYLARRHPIYS